MRHSRDMGAAEVEAFLNMLVNERKVSASTHNKALSAILFLYCEVLGIDVSTTMIYKHVLKVAGGGTTSPLDSLACGD